MRKVSPTIKTPEKTKILLYQRFRLPTSMSYRPEADQVDKREKRTTMAEPRTPFLPSWYPNSEDDDERVVVYGLQDGATSRDCRDDCDLKRLEYLEVIDISDFLDGGGDFGEDILDPISYVSTQNPQNDGPSTDPIGNEDVTMQNNPGPLHRDYKKNESRRSPSNIGGEMSNSSGKDVDFGFLEYKSSGFKPGQVLKLAWSEPRRESYDAKRYSWNCTQSNSTKSSSRTIASMKIDRTPCA